MERFVRWMEAAPGRLVRMGLGVVLIAFGLVGVGGTAGIAVALIGLVPLIAGALGPCLVRPLVRPARAR